MTPPPPEAGCAVPSHICGRAPRELTCSPAPLVMVAVAAVATVCCSGPRCWDGPRSGGWVDPCHPLPKVCEEAAKLCACAAQISTSSPPLSLWMCCRWRSGFSYPDTWLGLCGACSFSVCWSFLLCVWLVSAASVACAHLASAGRLLMLLRRRRSYLYMSRCRCAAAGQSRVKSYAG